MVEEIQIRIKDDELRFVYSDSLRDFFDIGECDTKRASMVEPDGKNWKVDLSPVNGPIFTNFEKRSDALEAEKIWLLENKIPLPK